MKIYLAKMDETLESIAQDQQLDITKLMAMNLGLTETGPLTPGTKIILSKTAEKEAPQPEDMQTYTVVQGDTLWKLSKKWGVSLQTLIQLNPQLKNPNVLLSNETIYLPKQISLKHDDIHAHGSIQNEEKNESKFIHDEGGEKKQFDQEVSDFVSNMQHVTPFSHQDGTFSFQVNHSFFDVNPSAYLTGSPCNFEEFLPPDLVKKPFEKCENGWFQANDDYSLGIPYAASYEQQTIHDHFPSNFLWNPLLQAGNPNAMSQVYGGYTPFHQEVSHFATPVPPFSYVNSSSQPMSVYLNIPYMVDEVIPETFFPPVFQQPAELYKIEPTYTNDAPTMSTHEKKLCPDSNPDTKMQEKNAVNLANQQEDIPTETEIKVKLTNENSEKSESRKKTRNPKWKACKKNNDSNPNIGLLKT